MDDKKMEEKKPQSGYICMTPVICSVLGVFHNILSNGISWKTYLVLISVICLIAVFCIGAVIMNLRDSRRIYNKERNLLLKKADSKETSDCSYAVKRDRCLQKFHRRVERFVTKGGISMAGAFLAVCFLNSYSKPHAKDLKNYICEISHYTNEVRQVSWNVLWNHQELPLQYASDQERNALNDEENMMGNVTDSGETAFINDDMDEGIEENNANGRNDGQVWSASAIPKPTDYRFILDEPGRMPQLRAEVLKRVFFLEEDQLCEIDNQVAFFFGHCTRWKENCSDKELFADEIGNDFYTYLEEEADFLRQIEDAADINEYDTWLAAAPHSSQLDEYMSGRVHLLEITVNDVSGCYELWWLLANDYQRYAIEYEAQTENAEAIFYYYTMSIFCALNAIQYDITDEQYKKTYEYIKMRYNDLKREEAKVPSEYKNYAKQIYNAMALMTP